MAHRIANQIVGEVLANIGVGSNAEACEGAATNVEALMRAYGIRLEDFEHAPPPAGDVLVSNEQIALTAEESARDYATRAARLRSDGTEAALSIAETYSAKAEVLRDFASTIRALPAHEQARKGR